MIHCPFNFGYYLEAYNLLICRPRGELTPDLMNDIAICRECITKANLAQVNRFHNLSDITSVHLNFEKVNQICITESTMRDLTHPIKAAYLVPNPLLYGTIRMYQALIEGSGVEVAVSTDINELSRFLGVDASVLTSEHNN